MESAHFVKNSFDLVGVFKMRFEASRAAIDVGNIGPDTALVLPARRQYTPLFQVDPQVPFPYTTYAEILQEFDDALSIAL